MKKPLTFLLTSLFILNAGTINATNYYFSSSGGNDSYTSTQAQNPATPWQSLTKLNSFFSSLQPGDSVLFKCGDIFYGKIVANKSGLPGLPIVLASYGTGTNPIITGFSSVTSWTNISGNIWESNTAITTSANMLNMVTINGAFQPIGRYPKLTDPNGGWLTTLSHTWAGGSWPIAGSITGALAGSVDYTGGEVVMRKEHWIIDRAKIASQSYSSGNTTVSFIQQQAISGFSTTAYPPQDGYGFFFQNNINTCTQQGEWAFNTSTKKIQVYSLGTPSGVQVTSVDTLIYMASKSYISFENLNVTGANTYPFLIYGSSAHITIDNCNITYGGVFGVYVDGSASYFTITNCNISYVNVNAINGTGSINATVENNVISNCYMITGMGQNSDNNGVGININSNNSVIKNNEISNMGYVGINFEGTGISIQNNYIHDFCIVKDDGSAIYTGNSTNSGTSISNNIILNGIGAPYGTANSEGSATGIYVDNGTNTLAITGNTIANCVYGIYLHMSQNIQVHDNITYNNRVAQFLYSDKTGVMTNLGVSRNILCARTTSQVASRMEFIAGYPVSGWGTIDSNYYCRPISEPSGYSGSDKTRGVIDWFNAGVIENFNSLDIYKSTSGKDANSKKSPKAISDTSQLRFEYNPTQSPKTINLGATYIGIDSTIYSGTITLAPYTSKVLIYLSGTISNQPPVANAGPDQNFFLPTNSATLTGSGSDADGSIASYQWTKISGPTQFAIVSPTQAQTVINNLAQGVYQFQLTVTDNLGATGKDTVVITVNAAPNQAPTANAGANQNITLPTNSVTIVGSGSDPDGTIASYQWTKISGPTQFAIVSPTQAQTVINNLLQGVYQFQLTVTDNLGATGKDTVVITVNAAPNQAPTANAGANQNITLPTNSVTIVGSGSDPDGTIASYQWTKISGPTQFTIVSPTQAQTVISNLAQGIYQFQLTVTDNQGATGKDTLQIIVNPANQPPVANAGTNQNITLPTNSVTLIGSANDPDGTIASYSWTKISGPTQFTIVSPSQAQTVINNLIQGTYQFQLTVTDNQGATGVSTVTVTVNAAPNQAPTANAGPNQNITLPTNSITLSGSGTDPDGTITAYKWRKISGPNSGNITNSNAATTTVTGLIQGIYQYELRVTDNSGAYGRDTIQVNVNAANIAPTADAGANQNVTLPTNSVTVSGSGTDPDGTIVSYQWSIISGPAQYNIVSPSQAQTVINNLVQGTYQFQLTVTDNQGATGTDIIVITVNATPNQPPVADAGPNQNITLPTSSATLSGSGTDADGTVVSYSWTKISGPTQFTIISPSQAQTVVNNLVQGTYQFQLTVTDNQGSTGIAIVTIIVNPAPNQAPTANAGTDQNITLPTNSVTLTGSGTDPDGSIISYQWSIISGPAQFTIVSQTQAQTVVNNLVQGTYQFQLTVTDNSGATGTDVVTITVNPAPNQAPTANAGSDLTISLPTNTATLSGSGWDPDGNIASYQWTKISGPTQFTIVSPTQAQTVINNLVQGVYQFQLIVTDNQGATGKDTVQVTVNPANIPPTANAGINQNITLPTNSVTLTGSGSDPDGNIASYQWTKISGPTQFTIVSPTQAQTVVNNLVQGVYQFQLKVTDNSGATATANVTVTVNPAPNQAPSANAGSNQNITLPTNNVTLTGSGSDPDGNIASYQWTKISGPTQFTIVSPTQAQTVINNLVQGVYQFQLKVTDNLGATATATVTVTVNPAPNQAPSANAGTDQTITLPVNTVTLSGSGTDPDGTIVSYSWTRIAGPTQFSIVSPTQAQTVINNLVQGVYVFQLTVTDNSGATATDLVTVTVNAAALLSVPIANAGSDMVIVLPVNSVTLSGSGSSANGSIVSYSWSQVSGPAASSIVSPSYSQTSIINLQAGIYQFELTVTDSKGMKGKDTVQVTVENSPNRNATAATAKLYPNPASTTINIEIDGATQKSSGYIKIYNSAGNVVYHEEFKRDQFTITKQIDVSSFAGGIYFVSVTLDANTQTTLKFVKE